MRYLKRNQFYQRKSFLAIAYTVLTAVFTSAFLTKLCQKKPWAIKTDAKYECIVKCSNWKFGNERLLDNDMEFTLRDFIKRRKIKICGELSLTLYLTKNISMIIASLLLPV